MAITVEAVYENGELNPRTPLPLTDNATVQITVHTESSPLMQAYGIMGWSGDAETLRHIALDPEFLPEQAP